MNYIFFIFNQFILLDLIVIIELIAFEEFFTRFAFREAAHQSVGRIRLIRS